MQQLEIKFFWPLVEQIPLDFDYTESDEFRKEMFRKEIVSVMNRTGDYYVASSTVPTTLQIKSSPNYVGHWEVQSTDFRVYKEKKPSWLHRKFNETLIGWVWKDDK
jgi:hypothetical protein